MLLTGVAYGSIADSINDFVKDNETLADVITAQTGASLIDSYLAMSYRILALVTAGFAIQSVLRVRSEETSSHAEQVLATACSRTRWAGSHLAVAVLGSILLLVVAGVSVGVSAAAVTGDASIAGESIGASLVSLPAIGVLIGGLSGLFMAFHAFGGLPSRLGFACLAVAWLYSGFRAYFAVRACDFLAHRRWMVRNFALTFAAVTLRVYLPASMALGAAFEVAYPVIAWLCWLPNLVAAECLLNRSTDPLIERPSAGFGPPSAAHSKG